MCDEVTNTEKCIWDGGDCCLDIAKKETSFCKICTCIVTVDIESLLTTFAALDVHEILINHNGIQDLILKTERTVTEVLDENVCSALCLDSSLNDFVNGWTYNGKLQQCSCLWFKSTKCLNRLPLLNALPAGSEESVTSKTFVGLAKTIDCGKTN